MRRIELQSWIKPGKCIMNCFNLHISGKLDVSVSPHKYLTNSAVSRGCYITRISNLEILFNDKNITKAVKDPLTKLIVFSINKHAKKFDKFQVWKNKIVKLQKKITKANYRYVMQANHIVINQEKDSKTLKVMLGGYIF